MLTLPRPGCGARVARPRPGSSPPSRPSASPANMSGRPSNGHEALQIERRRLRADGGARDELRLVPLEDFAGCPGDLAGEVPGPFREVGGIGELADEVQPQRFLRVD